MYSLFSLTIGGISSRQFVGAMPWKNTVYKKHSPDVELYHNQQTTQHQACSCHSGAIYKVVERACAGIAMVMKIILLFCQR